MENKQNRHFYNPTDDDDLAVMTEGYRKNPKNYIRFLCRITEENIPLLKQLEGFEDITPCRKNPGSHVSRDRVTLYNFNTIPYCNSEAKDYLANHLVIITKPEDKDKLKKLLGDSFGDEVTFTDKSKGITITTHVGQDEEVVSKIWKTDVEQKNKYPISIVSLGRHNKYGKTHLFLTKCKIQHYLFVEPREFEKYAKWYDPTYCEIIVGENFSSTQKMGSTPMRNFILDYWKGSYNMCWILDDNIKCYKRYYQGVKQEIQSHSIFSHVENYVEQYDNVGLVSHNINAFVNGGDCRVCLVKNGKCYTSMLVWTNNDIRFRYKHQEDNLMSMEYINKGYCNLCFNSVVYDKETSGRDKGGNATDIYKVKEGDTDGEGYKERYEYFECILKILQMEGKLKLQEGKTINDLLKRSTTMKSKEYHAKLNYGVFLGCDNEIK